MVSNKKIIEKYNKFKKEYDSKKINELLDVIRRFDGNSELYDFFSRYTSMQKFIEMAYKENDFEKVDKYIDGFNNNLAKVYEGKSKEAISGFNDVLDDIIGDIEEDTKTKLDEIKKDNDAPDEVKEQIKKIDEYIENRDKTMEGSEVSLLVACQRELDGIMAKYSRPELTEDIRARIEEAVDIKMREIQEEKDKAQKNVTSYDIAELKEYNEISEKIDSVVTKNQIESDVHEATKKSVEQDLSAVKGYLDIPEVSVNYEECKNDYDVVAQASEKIAESANFDREAQQSILDGMLEVIENANIIANTEYDRYLSFGSDVSELERTRATLLNEMNELNLALDMLRFNSELVEEVPDAIKQKIDEIEEKYNQRVNQYYSINSRINVLNDKKEKVKEDVSEKLNKEYESNETRISDRPKIKIGFFDKVKDVFTKGAASMKKKQAALMDTYVKPKLEVTKAGLKESEERCENQGVISRAKNTSMRAKAAIMAGIALISSGAKQIEEVPLTAEDFSQSIISTDYELVDNNDGKNALETSTSVAVEDFYKSHGAKINKLVEEKGYDETEKEVIVSNLISTWQNYGENAKILDFSLNGTDNTRDDEINQIIDNLDQKVINFDCEKNAKVNGVVIGGYTRYHKDGTDDVIINTDYTKSFSHEMQHVNMGYVGCQMNFINPTKMDIFFSEGAANYSKVLVQDNFIQSGGFKSYFNLMPTYTMLNTIVGEDTIKNWLENDWQEPNFDLCGAIISKIQDNCNVDQKTAEKYLQTLENSLEFDRTWNLPLAEGENLTEYQKSGLKAYEKTKNQTPEEKFESLQNQTLDLLGRQLDMAKSQEEIDVITKKMNALTLFSIDYTTKYTGETGNTLEKNSNHYEDAVKNEKANELISDIYSRTETNLSREEFTEAVQSKNNDVISYIDSLEVEKTEAIKQAEEQKRAEEEAQKQAEEQKRAEEEVQKQAEEQKRAEEQAKKDRIESARKEQAKYDAAISLSKNAQIVMTAKMQAERDGRLGENMKVEKQVSNNENRDSKEESKEENDITESDIIRSESSKSLIDKVQKMKSRDSLGRIKAEIVMKLNDGEISPSEAAHIAKKLNEQLVIIDDKKRDIDISENKKYSQEPPKKDDEICM